MSTMNRESSRIGNLAGVTLFLLSLLVFFHALLATAWLCDDAHISYRVADNVVNGYGLRWNVVERVQAFTHPLWLFVNTAAYAVTGEGYFTWFAVSIVTSMLAVMALALGVARNWGGAALGVVLLLFSRAFVDYCGSGLENPLTYLVMALFLIVFFRQQWSDRTLLVLSLLTALAALNRMDTVLFYAPPLAYAWLTKRTLRATGAVVLGLLPFVAWEIFSLVYYGFPFPNTAYAKLGTGIASGEMFEQGLSYFKFTWDRDPSTMVFLLIGLAAGFFMRDRRYAMLSIGGALYLFYIAKIGGDFMGGRFFGAPLFLAVALLMRLNLPALAPRTWVIGILAAAFSLSQPFSPPVTGTDIGRSTRPYALEDGTQIPDFKDLTGVGDERRFYYNLTGLLAGAPEAPSWTQSLPAALRFPAQTFTRTALAVQNGTVKPMPSHSFAEQGRTYRATGEVGPKVHGSIGFRGFLGGPTVYIVDYYALADPLLARIPAKFDPEWRVGHFFREQPTGYVDSTLGENTIQDPNLREYYEHLKLITRGPLFSTERWKAMYNMNMGRYDHLIDWDTLRFPGLHRVRYEQVSTPKAAGSAWDAPGTIRLHKRGLHIDLGQTVHNSALEFSLDNTDRYLFLYMRNGEVVAQRAHSMPSLRTGGLAVVPIPTPLDCVRHGFDAVRIFPHVEYGRKEDKYSFGHVKLL